MASATRSHNGRRVVTLLLLLCFGGFIATLWNYTRNHPFSKNAILVSNTSPAQLVATFAPDAPIQKGQRVVVKIEGDSVPVRGGIITDISSTKEATISIDTEVTSADGSAATVSIDGTIAPQPVK